MKVKDLSKTMVKGKHNNTNLGRTMKNGGIYMTHKAKIIAIDSTQSHGRGNGRSWNSELSKQFVQCFKSDGLDQAKFLLTSVCIRHKCWRMTHYPSTPASKALRLSSKVDIPVRARMRVPLPFESVDSIRRISFVAPTPSSSGIDMSRSTILIFDVSMKNRRRHAYREPTRIVLQSRTSLRHHVR